MAKYSKHMNSGETRIAGTLIWSDMKYSNILLILLLSNCSTNLIKVDIDPELSTAGITAWKRNIKYINSVGDIYPADIYINYNSNIINRGSFGRAYDTKPVIIEIGINNDVIIAHEFGHALGYIHNENINSIMNPAAGLYRQLNTFEELK